MKICVECKHAIDGATSWHCHHPELLYRPDPSMVTGLTPPPSPRFCVEARGDNNLCGAAAKYWEIKPPKYAAGGSGGKDDHWPIGEWDNAHVL